ncbi:MAG: excinuclease ABC subunit UvrC [Arcanobacterium sp.]|nr:excinuclease ABC subunit UvrC [Arcanobacterium sp.]
MADPQSYRPKTSDIPAQPGVYRFIDAEDRVIYVGKAKSLRARLVNYFQPPEKLHPRTRTMVFTAVRVVWVVVANESAALTLEYQWIKEFSPRFNVIFRDDKSYPYLAVTTSEEFPRLLGTRAAHKKGDKYYGPYTKGSIRDSVDLLLKVFPVRSCTKGVFNQARRSGRPCLNGYIDRCVAPCVGRVNAAEHRELVNELISFLDSDGSELIAQKTEQMQAAAATENFEQAARLRDESVVLKALAQKNAVVMEATVDADVFGLDFDELEASVQVFYVRGGRIRGQRGWVSEIEDTSAAQLLEELLVHVYGDGAAAAHAHDLAAYEMKSGHSSQEPSTEAHRGAETRASRRHKTAPRYVDDVAHTATSVIPREIWLPAAPSNRAALEQWLSELCGGRVHIKTPERGKKAQLMATVHLNAAQALQRHKLARSGDLTVRSQALEELREGLGLERAPLRIECFDISHTQGTNQVASMVVFEDGLAKKADYRKFIIRGEHGEGAADDTAAMAEVLTRRLSRLAAGARPDDASDDEPLAARQLDSDSSAPSASAAHSASGELVANDASNKVHRFAYRPDLIVVDGGLPQVNAAQRVIADLGVDVAVIGLAKRLEEVWIPSEEFPLILPRQSAALHLLQYVRDESHRFAITFHRKKRAKSMVRSALDAVPGLGPSKQKALLKHFGSLARIKEADAEALQRVPGIGAKMAQTILTSLSARPALSREFSLSEHGSDA